MKYHKLRIVWSVGLVMACVPLLVLWALSYSEVDHWDPPFWNSRPIRVWIALGRIVVEPAVGKKDATWEAADPLELQNWGKAAPRWSFGDQDFWSVPIWLPVMLASVLAVATLIPWSLSFTLRTLLIATTLIAVGLGLIVWLR
jgi:hypothetical protein